MVPLHAFIYGALVTRNIGLDRELLDALETNSPMTNFPTRPIVLLRIALLQKALFELFFRQTVRIAPARLGMYRPAVFEMRAWPQNIYCGNVYRRVELWAAEV